VSTDAQPTATPPFISVIIPSVNGFPELGECLEAMRRREPDVDCEILVVDRCGEETRRQIRERFPAVQVIDAPPNTSIPALRAMGMHRARGRIIAITEDHVLVPPCWFQRIREAHAAGFKAIAGPVENGSVDRLTDWAVFFCEYAPFMPPAPTGVVPVIAGNNTAYDRELLGRVDQSTLEQMWEYFLHQQIRRMGVPFYRDEAMTVSHKKEFGFWYFLSQRYHYSRSFAAMRTKQAPMLRRMIIAAATPLLPPLLLVRMYRSVMEKRRHVKEFFLSLPLIFPFLISWAWGEAVGALLGPGASLERVE
jgi:GT2 family glycosyltransferase